MTRLELLNRIAAAIRATTYLEIGVQRGLVFRLVNIPSRVGVDPDPTSAATIHRTSDDFFADLPAETRFDLIFVDGLHLSEQVEKDVANALAHLTPGGLVVLHDCDPPTKRAAEREMDPALWCGDVWRAWTQIRATLDPDRYVTFTVDADLGLGVIAHRAGPNAAIHPPAELTDLSAPPTTWQELQAHRVRALGLVTPERTRWWARLLRPLR